MIVKHPRRLPGICFEAQQLLLDEVLPRMDITVFVGFSASGPMHTPVAIDDLSKFTDIFGDDVPLCWDEQRGVHIYANLAPAVRAFFRNGGRRCWIVRIAGQALYNYFPIPGLAQITPYGIEPAFLQARSEGSWSDYLKVGTSLQSQPIEVMNWSVQSNSNDQNIILELNPNILNSIQQGDLLRLHFRDEGFVLMLAMKNTQLSTSTTSPPTQGLQSTIQMIGKKIVWLKEGWVTKPSSQKGQAYTFTHLGKAKPIPAVVVMPEQSMSDLTSPPIQVPEWPKSRDEKIQLDLQLSLAQAPIPGSLMRVDFGAEKLWLTVHTISTLQSTSSPPHEMVRVTGEGLWQLDDMSSLPQDVNPSGGLLKLELWVRHGDTYPMVIHNLTFAPAHPRYLADLPTDEILFNEISPDAGRHITNRELHAEADFRIARQNFWNETSSPRFPLAGYRSAEELIYFPISMSFLPGFFSGPEQLPDSPTVLERDGLADFNASMFLDSELIERQTITIMQEANFIRYHNLSPRKLKGIHAALSINEATLIAVPDAVHRGWKPALVRKPTLPIESAPIARPQWWHFLDCNPPEKTPLVKEPFWENFLDCDLEIIDPPELYLSKALDSDVIYTLSWTTFPDANYILEESSCPDFQPATQIYNGEENRFTIYGHTTGDYYYRVRTVIDRTSSDWSNCICHRIAIGKSWKLNSIDDYSSDTLLAIHRALIRMCAARGDLFTVMSLPQHFNENNTIDYLTTFKSPKANTIIIKSNSGSSSSKISLPLTTGEIGVFNYAAIYHPWLITLDPDKTNKFLSTPPDGAVCGLFARRALSRGAWIAPANEPLRGIIGLTSFLSSDQWSRLYQEQINVLRQEPNGFILLSEDTLSDDIDMRPINVRRLLMLLRRLAFKLGETYVFEPNNDVFRRMVQRGFESLMDYLFVRGAFAGKTPETSYQVITSDTLNTAQSLDQGRFMVELQVAPSLPMDFITIRLIQTLEKGIILEER